MQPFKTVILNFIIFIAMKIILFGGAFNPVHNEHVAMLRAAKERLGADRAIIMPTAVSPHKSGFITAPPSARLEMCRMAFGGIGEVSDFEISKGGASYSYVTCEYIRHMYPDDEIFFLMGADMFGCFSQWVYPERILKCVKLAVCAREGCTDVNKSQRDFMDAFGERATIVGYKGAAVSSTRIRVCAALGADISHYVPACVAAFISEQGLYAIPSLARAQKLMTEKRAAHVLRVAFMAAENCRRFKIPEKTAVTAAALHDCAKNLKLSDKLLKGFVPPEGVPDSVMHQFSGAYVAEHEFGITDEDILNAIRYHTSGRAGMSDLEKLICFSDMLEEGRDYPGVDRLRELFKKDVDLCAENALKEEIEYLEAEKKTVYPLTRQAYEYFRGINQSRHKAQ